MIRTISLLALATALLMPLPGSAYAEGAGPLTQRAAHRGKTKPPGYQSRRFRGGEGASWKTGRNAYGFQGRYGGCQYRGNAGPGGYRIDRVC